MMATPIPGDRAAPTSIPAPAPRRDIGNCRRCGIPLEGADNAADHLWSKHGISVTPGGALIYLLREENRPAPRKDPLANIENRD